jgi:hypothetical protein
LKEPKTVSELLDERIKSSVKTLVDEFNAEKDPKTRLQIHYDIAKRAGRTSIREIAKLSEKEWKRFLKEQVKPFAESVEKTSQEILDQKLKHGQLSARDLGLLSVEGELLEHFNLLTRADEKLLAKRRNIERILVLFSFQYFGMAYGIWLTQVNFEPFNQANAIVARRFGADQNWIMAIALLAIHESLVKKKLIELGVSDQELSNISRKRGFGSLIDRLASQIERKEKRRITLTFYKTSSLRAVRNRLEHEGYKLTVTRDEVLDLTKDTLRFETELFPNPSDNDTK